jgi:spermidine synthase
MTLWSRGEEFAIRVDGIELMSSRQHGSEESLAQMACEAVAGRSNVRVLVGGLGMGFTLRAALDALPDDGSVVVAEIVPEVVFWNRKILAPLADSPLEDSRVEVAIRDVARVIQDPAGWDAIMLDVDNGPAAVTRDDNDLLYSVRGLETTRQALREGGVLAVWSVSPNRRFEERLRKAGFLCQTHQVPARTGRKTGSMHTLFMARPREVAAGFSDRAGSAG